MGEMNVTATQPSLSLRGKRRQGFTLIELMVAIAIIAILALFSASAFQSVSRIKNQTVCLNNLRQIGVGVRLYCGDNNNRFPPYSALPKGLSWDRSISPYLNAGNPPSPIFKCPADEHPYDLGSGRYARSYSFSAMLPDSVDRFNNGLIGTAGSRRETDVTTPSDTIMVFDYWSNYAGKMIDNVQGTLSCSITWLTSTNPATMPRLSNGKYSHGLKANFLFADGHADSIDPKLAFKEKPAGSGITMWTAVR